MRAGVTTPLCVAAMILSGCMSMAPQTPPTPQALQTPQVQPVRLGLKLAPSTLGTSISLQQQLRIVRGGRADYLDGALEVDNTLVSMVGLAMGQRVLTLEFDGKTLKSWRHARLPEQVRAEDVLEDIQLTYWPAAAIRAVLPHGWRLEEDDMQRTLWADDAQVMMIQYSEYPRWSGKVTLSNLRYQYQLTIQSISTD